MASMQSCLLMWNQTTSFMVAYYKWEQAWRLFHQNLYEMKLPNEFMI